VTLRPTGIWPLQAGRVRKPDRQRAGTL